MQRLLLDNEDSRLLIPTLRGFYDSAWEVGYAVLRFAAGSILLVHGYHKLMTGVAPVAASVARVGFYPAEAFGYFVIFLETIGAICIALGLLTRFFAAALAIEMAVISFMVEMPHGFSRMEHTLLWGLVFLAIALRGGGPYSLDWKIGREL
jgi:putative oxidoreductase